MLSAKALGLIAPKDEESTADHRAGLWKGS